MTRRKLWGYSVGAPLAYIRSPGAVVSPLGPHSIEEEEVYEWLFFDRLISHQVDLWPSKWVHMRPGEALASLSAGEDAQLVPAEHFGISGNTFFWGGGGSGEGIVIAENKLTWIGEKRQRQAHRGERETDKGD